MKGLTHLIVAIDGPAASGKGTIAKKLAEYFNLSYLDTGILYRAVALQMLTKGMNEKDSQSAEKAARQVSIASIDHTRIRTRAVSDLASKIATISGVREELLDRQRRFAQNPDPGKDGAILDGRDIGTVVCPHADFKIFIMADLEIRAKRRWKELLQSDPTVIYCEVLEEMRSRDERDTNRKDAPLAVTSGALVIDTSNKSIDVSFNEAKDWILSRRF
ncbi:MAG: cytidylate kinase [Rhodospirillaceae bacterium]|nr:cytidylate kinase [Rhodospirillaceae bacterium]|tara:strand:- start:605 stop:1258 length:654 start_codon:yes stop_codon:yes gene_type:complete